VSPGATAAPVAPRLPAGAFRALAVRGLCTPIGTDLVLHERPDPPAVLLDGERLAGVVAEAAERYRTPLAVPLMDLRLEKADLVHRVRPGAPPDAFHFDEPPTGQDLALAHDTALAPFPARHRAHLDAIARVAALPGLVPLGMAIGPFSLLTKLLPDPISAVALAGRGVAADDEPLVAAAEGALALAESAVRRSIAAQLDAGAAAVIVCEPAASALFISPRQLAAGSPVYDRFVVEPLRRVKALLDARGALLFLHDCGEVVDTMVEALATRVRPAVLSLGSSRRLWEDARLVPDDVVLFGNLPTKHFYSDATLPVERVREMTRDLVARMRAAGRPFILGSECDVLHVPEAGATIRLKVEAMLREGAA
jgi:uroporphyrinogen-III decarboxylase